MKKECEMCGSEDVENFYNTTEWKTVSICYSCGYVFVKKRFHIKNREEEKILCDFEKGLLKENKQKG